MAESQTSEITDDLDEEDRIEREIIKDELSRKLHSINI